MADLDFSHHVSQVPAQEQLPRPLQRSVGVETHNVPDFQGAATNYAQATNWMSSVGSYVAAKASNAIATQLGVQAGKNPRGILGLPLTDFDENFNKSYATQAQATLGLQANKLIIDSNIALAKTPRITPELIQKTNQSISTGLENIFQHAPDEIKPDLQNQYANQQLQQTAELSNRMIREQKEDRRNNTALAVEMNAEHAYSFALAGNEKAALAAIENTKTVSDANVAAGINTPEQAKVSVDTARKSYLNGKMIREYESKTPDEKVNYLKSIADKKPSYLSDADYLPVTNNLLQHVYHQEALRSQDEQLHLAKFNTMISQDLNKAGSSLMELKQNVTPIEFERAQLSYINAVKANHRSEIDSSTAVRSWSKPEDFEKLTSKQVERGFESLVVKQIQDSQSSGQPMTREQAEVAVAASAGGRINYFRDVVTDKIHSGDPAQMDAAAQQIQDMAERRQSLKLGLSAETQSINADYNKLRATLPANEAAKIAIENSNQDPDTQKSVTEMWNSLLQKKSKSMSHPDFALNAVGLKREEFMNVGIANDYGHMILGTYEEFYKNLKGDNVTALKLTKETVDQNFGYTMANGKKYKTLHPIEKVVGHEDDHDVVPFIHQDLMNNLSQKFSVQKKSFDEGHANEYWEIESKPAVSENNHVKNKQPWFAASNANEFHWTDEYQKQDYKPVQVKRIMRSGKSQTYNVVLLGNSYNYDVSLQDDLSIRPLPQVAPFLHVATYTPNIKSINENYKNHVMRQ